jgi:ribosomal protein L7Ae-like RNA K-turn-binding protein
MEVEEGQHKSHTHDGTPEPEPANEGSRRSKRAKAETEADVEARKNAREKLITKRQEVREKCGFMAVGINAVTKALENKQLEVVVVCKVRLLFYCSFARARACVCMYACVCVRMSLTLGGRSQDVEPARLVQHVPLQAFLTDVPLVPLCGDLSLQLGAIFGIRTVMAIGFKVHAHTAFPFVLSPHMCAD